MSKLHIKKGDTVYVNAGEDKGKTGRVLKVLVKEGRAIVEGINMVSKSTKPNAQRKEKGNKNKEIYKPIKDKIYSFITFQLSLSPNLKMQTLL